MIAEGYTGRKGKGGFYRLEQATAASGSKSRSICKPASTALRVKASLESVRAGRKDLRRRSSPTRTRAASYAWAVLSHTLSYSALLVPEIADDIVKVDEGMKLGYAWKWGPFELLDKPRRRNGSPRSSPRRAGPSPSS